MQYILSEFEAGLSELKQSLAVERDDFDSKEHESRIEVERLKTEVRMLRDENLAMSEISRKLVRNVRCACNLILPLFIGGV